MSLVLDSTDHEHYRTGLYRCRRPPKVSARLVLAGRRPRSSRSRVCDDRSYAGIVDLEQAVARLAADISDQEVDEEQRRRKKDAATLSFSRLHWVKREMAIKRLYVA